MIGFDNKEVIRNKVINGEVKDKSSLLKIIRETQKEEIEVRLLNAKKSDNELYEKLVDVKLKILKEIVENGKEDEEILKEIDKTIKEKEELIESRKLEEIYYLEKRIKTIDEELPNARKYNGEKYVCMLFDSKIKILKEIVENGKEDEEILKEIDKTMKEKEDFIERRR